MRRAASRTGSQWCGLPIAVSIKVLIALCRNDVPYVSATDLLHPDLGVSPYRGAAGRFNVSY